MRNITLVWSGPGLYWPRWAGPKLVVWAMDKHGDALAAVWLNTLAQARKITVHIIGD